MTDKGRKSPDYLTRNILTVIYFQASTGNKICSRLLQALDGVTDHGVSVLLDVLDLIAEIIVKQGRNLANLHPVAVERLFPYLEHDRQAVRKRAIQAIHKVSHSASSQIQSDLLSRVITSLTDSSRGTELQRTILQARVSHQKWSLIRKIRDIGKTLNCYIFWRTPYSQPLPVSSLPVQRVKFRLFSKLFAIFAKTKMMKYAKAQSLPQRLFWENRLNLSQISTLSFKFSQNL